MPYPSSVDPGSGSVFISQGGALYIVDNNSVNGKTIYVDQFNQLALQTPSSDVVAFYDHLGNALFYIQTEPNGGIQLGNGVYINSTVTHHSPILGADANGTFVQAHQDSQVINLYDFSGNIIFSTKQSATTPDPGNGGTINTTGIGVARVTPTANRTGVILQAGTTPTQEVTVTNNSSSFTITFAAAGTSNVADGVSAVIAANRKMDFTWDSVAAKWYHS